MNIVVALQLATIVLSGGNIFILGEAYAFGVMWSFALKALAVLVLRYKQPGEREFRVPFNVKIGSLEIPIGLGVITAILFALCITNLFTKEVATISGAAFTLIFFAIFTVSEHKTRRHATAHAANATTVTRRRIDRCYRPHRRMLPWGPGISRPGARRTRRWSCRS